MTNSIVWHRLAFAIFALAATSAYSQGTSKQPKADGAHPCRQSLAPSPEEEAKVNGKGMPSALGGTLEAIPGHKFVVYILTIECEPPPPRSLTVDINAIHGLDGAGKRVPVIAHGPFAKYFPNAMEYDATLDVSKDGRTKLGLTCKSISFQRSGKTNTVQFIDVEPSAFAVKLRLAFQVPQSQTVSSVIHEGAVTERKRK